MTYYTDDANKVEYDMDKAILEAEQKEDDKPNKIVHKALSFNWNDVKEVPEEYRYFRQVEYIQIKATETADDFIFETIYPFCISTVGTKFNKKLLVDALTEFRKNHPERFREEHEDENESVAKV